MRPIERGPAPRVYAEYGDAIDDLVDRLGRYCSYCERRLPVSLAVEHMTPKHLHPDQELDWDNFLLGCTNCNSTKSNKDLSDDETLWPDRDNTLLALTYARGGFVSTSDGIDDPDLRARVRMLLDLVGLDRHAARGWPPPTDKDKRWQQREEIWEIAEETLGSYEALERSQAALSLIVTAALGYGFPSVWLTVFDAYPEVRLALLDAFPGTSKGSFDDLGQPVNRAGGVL
ncbi:HNH endonuclease [uncultured Thiohalocapsa sp.]|uniref:HNH endonuclease n=1 Tax=uncultured Thiohalocapsa sp. TaxID=768990 RepID=UPI0025F5B17F|nr:HNH endonuclease [uncultured Thiohalocapsa sp.]